jgi:hypothetical protein
MDWAVAFSGVAAIATVAAAIWARSSARAALASAKASDRAASAAERSAVAGEKAIDLEQRRFDDERRSASKAHLVAHFRYLEDRPVTPFEGARMFRPIVFVIRNDGPAIASDVEVVFGGGTPPFDATQVPLVLFKDQGVQVRAGFGPNAASTAVRWRDAANAQCEIPVHSTPIDG